MRCTNGPDSVVGTKIGSLEFRNICHFAIRPASETEPMPDLQELIQKILSFRDERNWKRFHTPRNLAAALAIEAGELQETMLWKTDREVEDLLNTPDGRTNISSEIADILIFCFLFCDATGLSQSNGTSSQRKNTANSRLTKFKEHRILDSSKLL